MLPGVSFSPFNQNQPPGRQGNAQPVQDAIQALSLRYPVVLGASSPVAPSLLSNGPVGSPVSSVPGAGPFSPASLFGPRAGMAPPMPLAAAAGVPMPPPGTPPMVAPPPLPTPGITINTPPGVGAPQVKNGLPGTDPAEQIRQFYRTYLGRDAAADDPQKWLSGAYGYGTDLGSIENAIKTSDEAQQYAQRGPSGGGPPTYRPY